MRKTKTHNVLRRLLAFVLIVSLLPLGYAGFKEDRYTSECRRSGVPESPRLFGAVKSRKF